MKKAKALYSDGLMKTPIDTSSFASQFFEFVGTDEEAKREAGVALTSDESSEALKFMEQNPDYASDKLNYFGLREYLKNHRLQFSAANLRQAWVWLKANGRATTKAHLAADNSPAVDRRKIENLSDAELQKTLDAVVSARRARRKQIEAALRQKF